MVNVAKLNKTIDELGVKAKEVDKIVKKQNDFYETTRQLKEINSNILKERETAEKLLGEIDELFNISKGFSVDMDKKFRENFSEVKNSLKEYDKAIDNLNRSVIGIENNVSRFNSDTLKKLHEIINENYKIINEFISILETKVNILKSDLSLEIRQSIDKMNQQMTINHKEIISKIDNGNNLILEELLKSKVDISSKYDELLLGMKESNKKNSILQIVSILLIVINLIIMFII